MNCPKCNCFVPTSQYTCPLCGTYVQQKPIPAPGSAKASDGNYLVRAGLLLAIFFIIVGAIYLYAILFDINSSPGKKVQHSQDSSGSYEGGELPPSYVINADNPGDNVDIEQYIQPGRSTIFAFYSDYCPACRKIVPLLADLDERRSDIAVLKIDINRPNSTTTDWSSPAAGKYRIKAVPQFKVYDTTGNILHEGGQAYAFVLNLLREEGLM